MMSFGERKLLRATVLAVGGALALAVGHTVVVSRGAPGWYPSWAGFGITVVPFAVYWFVLLRLHRKHGPRVLQERSGLCRACGYPLEGTDGACPECGRAYDPGDRFDDPAELARVQAGPWASQTPAVRRALKRLLVAVIVTTVACVAALWCVPLVPMPSAWTREATILARIAVGAAICVAPIVVFVIGYARVRKSRRGDP